MFLLAIAAAAWATPTRAADAVVGPGQCNAGGFAAALATVDGSGGGTITFNCGTATIALPNYHGIASTVTIDGADRITFDGANSRAFFQVYASAHVTLRRLTFMRGAFSGAHPLENYGSLTLDRVTVKQHPAGERIVSNSGRLWVLSSVFADNAARAIVNEDSDAIVSASRFERNRIDMGVGSNGAAISQLGGRLAVAWSDFSGNQAADGGALFIAAGTTGALIEDSRFVDNRAGYGGAVETWAQSTKVVRSRFSGNQAQAGDGGAIWLLGNGASIEGSQFEGNTAATTGGAVSCYDSGALAVRQSSFSTNQSGSHGGALHSSCGLIVDNSTFSGNRVVGAVGGGGAIHQDDTVRAGLVRASTLADNSAPFGGGVYGERSGAQTLFVAQSILRGNGGGNCAGVLGSDGYNLSSDSHCGGAFTADGDLNNATLVLQAYGDYGGPTSSMPPQAGNPAIDRVPVASCALDVDQRGARRPVGAGCDSGAVERGGVVDAIFQASFDLVSFMPMR